MKIGLQDLEVLAILAAIAVINQRFPGLFPEALEDLEEVIRALEGKGVVELDNPPRLHNGARGISERHNP